MHQCNKIGKKENITMKTHSNDLRTKQKRTQLKNWHKIINISYKEMY